MPAPRTTTRTTPRPASRKRPAAARPVLTPAEAEALRALLAARQAAGAPVVRRPAPRSSTTTRGRTRRATTRRPRTRPARDRASWSTRLGVVAAAVLVLPVTAALLLPATPDPDRAGGAPSAERVALAAHTSLVQQGQRYRDVAADLRHRQVELARARKAEDAARATAEAARAEVGTGAAQLFRASPAERLPGFALDLDDPASVSGVLYQQAVADRQDDALEGSVVRAQRADTALDAARRDVAEAEQHVEAAAAVADRLLSETRAEASGIDPVVAATIADLSQVPATGAQQHRNERAVARWQRYLATLAEAGIEPPAAAELADPDDMPAGMSPALDEAGHPIPGVAWAVVGSSPVTVLPAETVAAVSSAFSQLGKPYQPGATGPYTYDCGGFTAAAWLRGGWSLPSTPAAQWRTGTAVPVSSLQVGDLVLAPGGLDVGLYLGGGDVLGATAATYSVAVRSFPAGASAVRVTLGRTAAPNAALPAAPGARACGAVPAERDGGSTPNPAWGGFDNGRIPSDALCEVGVRGQALRCDAAAAYTELADAYADRFGKRLCITDSYRSFGAQLTAFAVKPALAAVPGTSNHGWALAVDLCGGVNGFGTPQWRWMAENAGRFGWVQPSWAGPRGEKPEPWHWEFGVIS